MTPMPHSELVNRIVDALTKLVGQDLRNTVQIPISDDLSFVIYTCPPDTWRIQMPNGWSNKYAIELLKELPTNQGARDYITADILWMLKQPCGELATRIVDALTKLVGQDLRNTVQIPISDDFSFFIHPCSSGQHSWRVQTPNGASDTFTLQLLAQLPTSIEAKAFVTDAVFNLLKRPPSPGL